MRLTPVRRSMAVFVLSGFILGVAGCQSGGVLGLGGKKDKVVEPEAPKVLESELRAYCPKVVLREGTAFLNKYAKGGDGDASKLLYQASIGDVTRTCARSGDTLVMTVAVAGKVVPGPADTGGAVTLPIRVVATQGTAVLYTNLSQHSVAMADTASATQFVFKDANVTMANPQATDIIVYAGFDEGPDKKGKEPAPNEPL